MTRPVMYAHTDDGLKLAIIDVTNPRFSVALSDADLATMADGYVRDQVRTQDVSPELRAALGRSRLGRGLAAAAGSFVTGMNTYLLKLGPDNLPDDSEPIDRRIADSFPALTTRLRLQDMAQLLQEGVIGALHADSGRPLHFINIAGGPAADSWNALIRLRADNAPLDDRDIVVAVLDPDQHGPAFGARALEALRGAGGPIERLDVRFRHALYHWTKPESLSSNLGFLASSDAMCAISSEGGLFEYGTDEDIAHNLAALHELTPRDAIIVGSAARDGELRRVHSSIGVADRPRTREAFQALIEGAKWVVETAVERPFSDNVRLVKRQIGR